MNLLLKNKEPKIRTKPRKFDVVMSKIETGYKKLLTLAINNRGFVVFTALFLLIFSGFTALRLGIAFIPSTDNGEFYIAMELPVGTDLETTRRKFKVAEQLLYKYVPEIDSVVFYEGLSNTKGISTQGSPESAYAHVVLKPIAERNRGVHQIMLAMQDIWSAAIPDSKISVQNYKKFFINQRKFINFVTNFKN